MLTGNWLLKLCRIEPCRRSNDWYINVPEANKDWCVDIGLLLPDGRFIAIARSNIVPVPRHGVSPVTDERCMKKDFDELVKLSGLEHIGKSSFEIAKLMARRWKQINSVSSSKH